jgi:hypothetical protein
MDRLETVHHGRLSGRRVRARRSLYVCGSRGENGIGEGKGELVGKRYRHVSIHRKRAHVLGGIRATRPP